MAALWEELESYLFERQALGEAFNAAALAEDWGIPTRDASRYIQSQLGAQSRPNSQVQFCLRREGRTSAAMWHVGQRASDARALAHQTTDDFRHRIRHFVAPTMATIGERNPRALPVAEAIVQGIEAGIQLMVAMTGGDEDGQETPV